MVKKRTTKRLREANVKFVSKCPMTNLPLKLKELITILPKEDVQADGSVKWLCQISDKELSHHKVVLVRETGHLILRVRID